MLEYFIRSFLDLIKPLTWNHKIQYVVPLSMLPTFTAGAQSDPFIIGVCPESQGYDLLSYYPNRVPLSSVYPGLNILLQNCVIVNVDNNVVYLPEKKLPTPPGGLSAELYTNITEFYRKIDTLKPPEEEEWNKYTSYFTYLTSSLYKRYREIILTEHDEETGKVNKVFFDYNALVRSSSTSSQKFLRTFLKSKVYFNYFIGF